MLATKAPTTDKEEDLEAAATEEFGAAVTQEQVWSPAARDGGSHSKVSDRFPLHKGALLMELMIKLYTLVSSGTIFLWDELGRKTCERHDCNKGPRDYQEGVVNSYAQKFLDYGFMSLKRGRMVCLQFGGDAYRSMEWLAAFVGSRLADILQVSEKGVRYLL